MCTKSKPGGTAEPENDVMTTNIVSDFSGNPAVRNLRISAGRGVEARGSGNTSQAGGALELHGFQVLVWREVIPLNSVGKIQNSRVSRARSETRHEAFPNGREMIPAAHQ
jgi:hypothetical protein